MLEKNKKGKGNWVDKVKKSALSMTVGELDTQIEFERCERLRNKTSQRIMHTPLTIFK